MHNSVLLKNLHDKLAAEQSLSPAVCAQIIGVMEKFIDRLSEIEAENNRSAFIDTVDFPDFVTDLIKGVFDALVKASIQQMEDYADLISSATESIDDFMADNLTDKTARDWLTDRHDENLIITDDETLIPGIREQCEKLKHILKVLGINISIDCPPNKKQTNRILELVKLREHQQQITSVVLMAINRIVINKGSQTFKTK